MRHWMTWRAGWQQVRLKLALTRAPYRSVHCSRQLQAAMLIPIPASLMPGRPHHKFRSWPLESSCADVVLSVSLTASHVVLTITRRALQMLYKCQ